MKHIWTLAVLQFIAGRWIAAADEGYVGCFADSPGRQLAGANRVIDSHMTPKWCRNHCAYLGYRLAGLEVGNECYCGDHLDEDFRVDESKCDRPCAGDEDEICGSHWTISVYKTIPKGFNAVKANYVGCYADNAQRFLNGTAFNTSSLQTPQYCVEFCRKKGFSYSATEVGLECFCGNSLENGNMVDNSECKRPCRGDKNLVCGDSWRLSVYSTMITGYNAVKGNYVDCFVDNAQRFLNGTAFNTSNLQTPRSCLEFCRSKGFSYSGTEVGRECFCGDTLENGTKVDDKECKRPCLGDTDLACGDSWRLSVYRTLAPGKSDNPVSSSYKGCYKEGAERSLNGLRKESMSLTPYSCYRLCRNQGFSLAGLQSGTLCLCGDWVKENDRVADSECSRPCAGDLSLTCGGNDIHASVYQTDIDNVPSSTYVGCFRDSAENRLLGAAVMEAEYMTIEQCVAFCYRRGFMFAGAHNGEECFCGDSLEDAEPLPNRMCSAACSGNRDQICGGYLKLTVYQTGITYDQISEPGQAAYLGCYVDSNARQLHGARRDLPRRQTPDTCIGYCFKQGFQLAGLQARSECFCGDKLKEGTLTEAKECDSECPGDPDKKCGGGWRLSVYSTPLRGRRPKSHLVGCFDDGGPQSLLSGAVRESAQMTIDSCFGFCYRSGYRFAGLKNGYKCFCGNDLKNRNPISNDNCNRGCVGNDRQKCGGTSTITVYNTGVLASATPKSSSESCEGSESRRGGSQPCVGQLLFKEDFDKNYLHPSTWSRVIYTPTALDNDFAEFTNSSTNAYVKEGKLYIRPTVTIVGHQQPSTTERIPGRIMSGRVETRNSFTFRYGKVQIRAKLPVGDWIVPELWLRPVGAAPGDKKGTLRVGMARGNVKLLEDMLDIDNIGNTKLELGVMLGRPESDTQPRNVVEFFNSDGWHADFHNFTLVWRPDNLYFAVDDSVEVPLISEIDVRFGDALKFFDKYSEWSHGSTLTPFNKQFFLSFGLSVGGWDFPDDSVSGKGINKPWKNGDPMAIYNFWSEKHNWMPTWKDEESALQIDSVTVTAL